MDRVSYAMSDYYPLFCELGYPMLDVVDLPDGSWRLIEWLNKPYVPSVSRWHIVLDNIRNTEKSIGFFKKYTDQLDLEKRHFWEAEEAHQEAIRQEVARDDIRAEDKAERCFRAIRQNPGLMERIAKNGLQEMGLRAISRQIPNHHFRR